MARKTKAELQAEQAAYQAQLVEAARSMYPTNLMNMLERATDLGYELTVRNSKFVVADRNRRNLWVMAMTYDTDSQETLDALTWEVEEEELRRLAEQARYQAKQTALAKLSKEERELLGL